MAEEKKVKEIDYEAAWNDLELTLRKLARALSEVSVSSDCVDYAVGRLTAYEKVLSIMVDFEEIYTDCVSIRFF